MLQALFINVCLICFICVKNMMISGSPLSINLFRGVLYDYGGLYILFCSFIYKCKYRPTIHTSIRKHLDFVYILRRKLKMLIYGLQWRYTIAIAIYIVLLYCVMNVCWCHSYIYVGKSLLLYMHSLLYPYWVYCK